MEYIIYGCMPFSQNVTALAFVSVGESLRNKIDELFDDGNKISRITCLTEQGEIQFRMDINMLKYMSSRIHDVLANEFENRWRN